MTEIIATFNIEDFTTCHDSELSKNFYTPILYGFLTFYEMSKLRPRSFTLFVKGLLIKYLSKMISKMSLSAENCRQLRPSG